MKAGERLNQYILERFLGEGGMGEVWLAKHHLLGRKVAIKSLRPQFVRQESLRLRFRNEAVTLSQLHHPGIVALHDYLEEDEGAYLVMEYVEGIPLDDYIRTQSGPITGARLKDFLTQILEAFAYAHGQNVVHRDIKPGNFMVTPEGKIKVLDFGIAKVLQGGKGITKTGTQIGTVLYMSPEQVDGKEIDIRSDIYSLGVTLFTMATGQPPYPADATEFHVYKQIVDVPLPDASSVYKGVDPAIQDIIRKATAKRKEDRYQNCGEMLQAVGALVTSAQAAPSKPTDTQDNRDKDKTILVEPGEQTQINEPGTKVQEPEMPGENRKKGFPWLPIGLTILVLGLLVGTYFGLRPNKDGPKEVGEKFLNAYAVGDYETAKKYATKDAQASLDMVASMSDDGQKKSSKIEIREVYEDGERAKLKYKEDGFDKELDMIIENGEWKANWTKGGGTIGNSEDVEKAVDDAANGLEDGARTPAQTDIQTQEKPIETPKTTDSDGDGVLDGQDECPKTKGVSWTGGCPDTDFDLVPDQKDKCPNEKGDAKNGGCPSASSKDSDGDGIYDTNDNCPYQKGGSSTTGCPDKDYDGIADYLDKCPSVYGDAQNGGCPKVKERDSDGDGVIDSQDECPNYQGSARTNGCSDRDGDGVADFKDNCPDKFGYSQNGGCPAPKKRGNDDSDGDGVIDSQDECPSEKGIYWYKGCPDIDGDGVPDYRDNCRYTPGTVKNLGCPE